MIRCMSNLYIKRELLFTLVKKEFTLRYKQSVLGPLWAFSQPVVLMLLFIMLQKFVGIKSNNIPYAVFVYSALLPWTFFSNSVILATVSFIQNAAVMKKIYFPREILPLSSILTSFIDFIIASVVMIILMIYYKIVFTFYILLIPILVLIQVMFTIGIGLITSSISVYKRDIAIGMPFIMQFWLFVSPVIYSLSSVPAEWKKFYILNPLVGLIEGYRNILAFGQIPNMMLLLSSLIEAITVFYLSIIIFRKLEKRFVDVV